MKHFINTKSNIFQFFCYLVDRTDKGDRYLSFKSHFNSKTLKLVLVSLSSDIPKSHFYIIRKHKKKITISLNGFLAPDCL